MRWEPRQKLAVRLPIMRHAQRLAGLAFLIHRDEYRKLLMRIASDKLFHFAAAPPCAWGFARSLRETPLQRFHSIINGHFTICCRDPSRDSGFPKTANPSESRPFGSWQDQCVHLTG